MYQQHFGVGAPENYRPLNVRDALTYLDQVKVSLLRVAHRAEVAVSVPADGCSPGGGGCLKAWRGTPAGTALSSDSHKRSMLTFSPDPVL